MSGHYYLFNRSVAVLDLTMVSHNFCCSKTFYLEYAINDLKGKSLKLEHKLGQKHPKSSCWQSFKILLNWAQIRSQGRFGMIADISTNLVAGNHIGFEQSGCTFELRQKVRNIYNI